jgi:hypothetical protein
MWSTLKHSLFSIKWFTFFCPQVPLSPQISTTQHTLFFCACRKEEMKEEEMKEKKKRKRKGNKNTTNVLFVKRNDAV